MLTNSPTLTSETPIALAIQNGVLFYRVAFAKLKNHTRVAARTAAIVLGAAVIGAAAPLSGCATLNDGYASYDRNFEREVQIEASTNDMGASSGTVRMVIKRKDGKSIVRPISARGGVTSGGVTGLESPVQIHRTSRAESFPNILANLEARSMGVPPVTVTHTGGTPVLPE